MKGVESERGIKRESEGGRDGGYFLYWRVGECVTSACQIKKQQ